MGIKIDPQPPYSRNPAPCDFWLFPKLRGCHYETIEEMKESVTKVIDTLTQEDLKMFLILAQVDNGRGIVIWGINAYLDENNGEVNMIEFYEEILFAFGHHQPIILNPVRNKY